MLHLFSSILTFSLSATVLYFAVVTIASLYIEKKDEVPKSVAAGMLATTGCKVLNRANTVLLAGRSLLNSFLMGVNLRKSNATSLKLEYQKKVNQDKYNYLNSEEHDSFLDSYAMAHPDFLGTLQTLCVSTLGTDYKEDAEAKEEYKAEVNNCVAEEKAKDAELRAAVDNKIKEEYPIATSKEYKVLRNELYKQMQQSIEHKPNPVVAESVAYKVGRKTNQIASSAISAATKSKGDHGLSWNESSKEVLQEEVPNEVPNRVSLDKEVPIKDLSTSKDDSYDPVAELKLEQSGKVQLSTVTEYKRKTAPDIEATSYEDEFGKPLTLEDVDSQEISTKEEDPNILSKADDNYTQSDTGVWCLNEENKEEKEEELICNM